MKLIDYMSLKQAAGSRTRQTKVILRRSVKNAVRLASVRMSVCHHFGFWKKIEFFY